MSAPGARAWRGASAGRSPSSFDARELRRGAREEAREHGVSAAVARRIAMDHLTEDPRYYSSHAKNRAAATGAHASRYAAVVRESSGRAGRLRFVYQGPSLEEAYERARAAAPRWGLPVTIVDDRWNEVDVVSPGPESARSSVPTVRNRAGSDALWPYGLTSAQLGALSDVSFAPAPGYAVSPWEKQKGRTVAALERRGMVATTALPSGDVDVSLTEAGRRVLAEWPTANDPKPGWRARLRKNRAGRAAGARSSRPCRCGAYPFPHQPGGGACGGANAAGSRGQGAPATIPDRHEPQRSRHRKWTQYLVENGYRETDSGVERPPGTFTRREAEAEAWRVMADEDAHYAREPRAYEGFDEDHGSDVVGRL